MDMELRLYKQRRQCYYELQRKRYTRRKRILGTVIIAVSFLLYSLHKEIMILVLFGLLATMLCLPEKRRDKWL